jgi:hypothetical protein
MATRLYSYDKGQNEYQITDATGSATTAGLEVTVDLAKITTREDLLLGLEKLTNYLVRGLWPPA